MTDTTIVGYKPPQTFIELTDAPSDYTGYAGYNLQVTDTADGLEFASQSSPGDITTDDAWIAAGDLIVGTGNGAATIVSKGTEGQYLKSGATTVEWTSVAFASATVVTHESETLYLTLAYDKTQVAEIPDGWADDKILQTTDTEGVFEFIDVPTGTLDGSTGSTDNAILRANGTGGVTLQNSLVTIDDSGSINIPTGQSYKINNTALTYTNVGAAASGHTHGSISNDGKIGSTANVPIITTTAGALSAGSFGTAVNTFCQGNDSRLNDSRTPTSHTHGNITNGGLVGTTANLPLITGTGGIVQASSFGTGANTYCQGNDSRLSNARTPTAHNLIDTTGHTASGLTSGHFLKATGATTYGFAAHGLTASDVGAVATTLFDANTVLAANTDNTPAAVTIAENDIIGRLPSGNIAGVTVGDLTKESTPAAGDYLLGWESGGAIRKFDIGDLPGGTTPTNEIFLSLAGGWPSGTTGDDGFASVETSTNKVNLKGVEFLAADSDDKYHEWGHPLPADYEGGTTITAVAYLYTASTDASDHTIKFGLAAGSWADGDTADAAYGTPQTVTETVSSSIAGKIIKTAATSALTIAGTPAAGDWVQWRTYRDHTDDNTGDVLLLGWMITYTRA